MNSEYGRVYSVETRRAGANLDGDHTAAATELNVHLGWDFVEEGGQLEVNGQTLTYTAATFPDPLEEDDDLPTVLTLDGTLGVDVDDGAFVVAIPGGEDKYATVEVTGQGEPVVALVDHALKDRLDDGIRGDAQEAETVLVVQDGPDSWSVRDIVARRPVIDLSYADESVQLPAPVIPEEGVTQYAQLVVDEAVIDRLDSTVIMSGEMIVAERNSDGSNTAEPGTAVLKFGAQYGLDVRTAENVQTLQAFGDNVYVDGNVRARSLEVPDGATWGGANVGAASASTMMANSVSKPGVQPTVEAVYDTVTLDSGSVAGDVQSERRGIVWDGSHWWVATRFDTGLGPWFLGVALAEFDADGTFVALHDSGQLLTTNQTMSLTRIGTSFYQAFSERVYRYSASGTFQDVTVFGTLPTGTDVVMGTDGTNLIGVWSTGPGSVAWQKYNPSTGAKVGSQVNTAGPGNVYAAMQGTFDYGAQRVALVVGGNFWVYDTSGFLKDIFPSPSAWRGACWTGSQFATLSANAGNFRTVHLHTGNLNSESVSPNVDLAPTSTWYSSDGPYETQASTRQLVAFPKRAKYVLRTSGTIPGAGGTGEPDGARFYIGRSTGRAKLERQATVMGTAGERAEVILDTLDLPTGTANASNPPPASSNFPNATPYRHYSQAVIPGTTDPQTLLEGDGKAILYGLVQPWLHVHRDLIRTLPNGDWTTQQWNKVVDYTPDGGISRTNDDFNITVVQAGVYEVSAQATANLSPTSVGTTAPFYCRIVKNGTEVAFGASQSGSTTRVSTSISGFKIRLADGDTLQYQIRQASGSSQTTTADGSANWLQITRVHN